MWREQHSPFCMPTKYFLSVFVLSASHLGFLLGAGGWHLLLHFLLCYTSSLKVLPVSYLSVHPHCLQKYPWGQVRCASRDQCFQGRPSTGSTGGWLGLCTGFQTSLEPFREGRFPYEILFLQLILALCFLFCFICFCSSSASSRIAMHVISSPMTAHFWTFLSLLALISFKTQFSVLLMKFGTEEEMLCPPSRRDILVSKRQLWMRNMDLLYQQCARSPIYRQYVLHVSLHIINTLRRIVFMSFKTLKWSFEILIPFYRWRIFRGFKIFY